MSRTLEITGNQLTNALRALDVNFILGGQSKTNSAQTAARLIAASPKLKNPVDDPEEYLCPLVKRHKEMISDRNK